MAIIGGIPYFQTNPNGEIGENGAVLHSKISKTWSWNTWISLKIVGAILWDKRIEPGMVQIPNGEPVRRRWPHNLKGRLLLDADMGLEQHMNCGCFSVRSPFYWPGGFSSLGETVLPTLLIKIVDWVAMSCHVAKKYAFHSGVVAPHFLVISLVIWWKSVDLWI